MLSVAGFTKTLGSVARGTSMSRTSRVVNLEQRRKVSSTKLVAGVRRNELSVPRFETKIGSAQARLYATDTSSKAKKKRKGFTSAAIREFFGKSSREELMKSSEKIPVAPKTPHRIVVHNQALRDDYHYMTQISTNETAQHYFAKEDEYAKKKIQTELSQYAQVFSREIESLETGRQQAPPEQVGEYFYYARQEADQQMAVYCRKKGINGPEEVILDANAVLAKHSQMFLATMKVNMDQTKLLSLIDTDSSELFDVHVRDLKSGKDLHTEILGVSNAEWAPDGKSFFYTEPDTKRRPYKVYKHVLGTPRSSDVLVYHENDDQHFVDVARTKDGRYLTINSNSKTTSELFLVDPAQSSVAPTRVFSRDRKTEFFLEHSDDGFYMVTADTKEGNYKVLRCGDNDITNMGAWKEFVPARSDVKIDDIDVFSTHVVLYERHQGNVKLRVINKQNSESKYIPVPSEIGHIEPGSNLDANAKSFRFTFTSPLIAGISYDYIFETGELVEVAKVDLPRADGARSAFNPEDYALRRVSVPTSGGVSVPLTLIHRKDMQPSSDNPTLLSAYGAYGHNLETSFDVNNIPLLQRGWCIAYAHVRGGGELGLKWHHNGRLMQKRNTFDDLANCARWLFEENVTSGNWLVGRGSSAGGLPFAVAANEHPGMFKALVLKNPFLDVVTTMLDDTLPLTVHEYDEWGNPHNKEVFEYLYSWDPYWNMRSQEYPHMFITSSIIDVRVPCSNHARYVAKLRTIKTDKNSLLLNIDATFGHFGDSSTVGAAASAGRELSFIYASLNIVPDRI